MSGVLKAVGKVFKKVVKVVKKIAIPALMIGAVVLTGGAALGVLPALGTVLGGIGITGTMASVLGGAISMGAVGAVTGGVMAGVQGRSIWKGAQGGFVTGAIGGAVGGGLGLISPNGVLADMGVGSSSANLSGLKATGTLGKFASPSELAKLGLDAHGVPVPGAASPAAAPGSSNPIGVATKSVQPVSTTAPATTAVKPLAGAPVAGTPAAVPASTGGLLHTAGSVLSNPTLLQLGGSILSGFAQGSAASSSAKAQLLAQQQEDDRTAMNYGYRNVYALDKKGKAINGVPIRQDQAYAYGAENLAQPNGGLLAQAYQQSIRIPYFQIVGGQVVQTG